MAETLSPTVLATERLKALFFPDSPLHDEGEKTVSLNSQDESVRAEYIYPGEEGGRRIAICSFFRKGKCVLNFTVGDFGLEKIGSNDLHFSFDGSPTIPLWGPISVNGDLGTVQIDIPNRSKFESLAEKLVNWTEKVVKNGQIGEVPFKITSK